MPFENCFVGLYFHLDMFRLALYGISFAQCWWVGFNLGNSAACFWIRAEPGRRAASLRLRWWVTAAEQRANSQVNKFSPIVRDWRKILERCEELLFKCSFPILIEKLTGRTKTQSVKWRALPEEDITICVHILCVRCISLTDFLPPYSLVNHLGTR